MSSASWLPMAVVASFTMVAFEGVGTLSSVFTGPMIEGEGQYSDPVRPGEIVLIEWDIWKKTQCGGHNARVWSGENGFTVIEPTMPNTLPASEEPRSYQVQTQIPELAPPGRLELSIRGDFRCSYGTQEFTLGPVILSVTED